MEKNNNNIEFLIKDTFRKYYEWLRKQISEELIHNNFTIKELNYLFKNNDFLHLLSLHLYYINKIILQNTNSFGSFIYDIIYGDKIPQIISNTYIFKQNYDVLLELLNHKEFSSLKCCYEKEYYYKGKIKKIKLEI